MCLQKTFLYSKEKVIFVSLTPFVFACRGVAPENTTIDQFDFSRSGEMCFPSFELKTEVKIFNQYQL